MNFISYLGLNFILPEIFLAICAIILLIIGAIKGENFKLKSVYLASFVLVISAGLLYLTNGSLNGEAKIILNNALKINSFNLFFKGLIVLTSAACLLFVKTEFKNEKCKNIPNEYPVIILLATIGMMLMISANDFISFYVSLELQSLALYLLASIYKFDKKSSEAGLKYFVLGSLASGIMLFGISYIYGFTGTVSFDNLAAILSNIDSLNVGFLLGLVLLLIGIFFKFAAAPFHMWSPDVYEGSPTIVTSFFATATKIAIAIFSINLLFGPFLPIVKEWQQIIIFVAVISMIVGSLGAIAQKNLKRLLAYSSIGHVGFILVGIASGTAEAISSVSIYLIIYVILSLTAFAFLLTFRKQDGTLLENINIVSGLSKTHPFYAIILSFTMLSMAGIPPFAGFFAKFYVFKAAINSGLFYLVIFALITSVISCYYYLRIIKIMYFDDVNNELNLKITPFIKIILILSLIFNSLYIFGLDKINHLVTSIM